MTTASDEELRTRACKAFQRSGRIGIARPERTYVATVDTLSYVVVRGMGKAVLGVYRVKNSGELRRLHKWPAVIEEAQRYERG